MVDDRSEGSRPAPFGGGSLEAGPDGLAVLRAAVEAMAEAVIVTGPDLEPPGPAIHYVNPAFTAMTGYAAGEVIGRTPRLLQGPATSRAMLDRLKHDLAAHGRFAGESVNYRKDGSQLWIDWRITAVRDADGRVLHWVSVQRDVSEEHALRGRQTELLAELQHRVRNAMAVIRELVRRTAHAADTLEQYEASVEGRVAAYARTQGMVTRSADLGVTLDELVAEELLSHGAQEGERLALDGPMLQLSGRGIELIGLVLHELAANATQHGVLGDGIEGRVDVAWHVDRSAEPSRLVLTWTETRTGEPLAQPSRRGFGRDLIERRLGYEAGARGRLAFLPDRVVATIELPLGARLGAEEVLRQP